MKKRYIKPQLESYIYDVERGFASSVGLNRDIILDENGDKTTLRASEELTEITDGSGEYDVSYWE